MRSGATRRRRYAGSAAASAKSPGRSSTAASGSARSWWADCCVGWATAVRPTARPRRGRTIPTATPRVDSRGRRNTAYVGCSKELVQSLGRCSPAQGLTRPAVEGDRHSGEVLGAVHAEVGALWKVLPQQPIGVLVRAALPGAVRIAEVDRHASLDP